MKQGVLMSDHSPDAPHPSRREFFRSLGRGAALGLLGGGAGLLWRRGGDVPGDGACPGRGVCGRCGLWRKCSLPLAAEFRKETRR